MTTRSPGPDAPRAVWPRGLRVADLMVLVASLSFLLAVGALMSRETTAFTARVWTNVRFDRSREVIEAMTAPVVFQQAANDLKGWALIEARQRQLQQLKAGGNPPPPVPDPTPTADDLRRTVRVRLDEFSTYTVTSATGDTAGDRRAVESVVSAFLRTQKLRDPGGRPALLYAVKSYQRSAPEPFGRATRLVVPLAMAAPIVAVVFIAFQAGLRAEAVARRAATTPAAPAETLGEDR